MMCYFCYRPVVLAGQVPFKNPLLLINPLTASLSFLIIRQSSSGKIDKKEFSRKTVEYITLSKK